MNVPGLSDDSLKNLHDLISEVIKTDDALPKDKKRFGVREYPDWKKQSDEFEAELHRRGLPFTPISWSENTGTPDP